MRRVPFATTNDRTVTARVAGPSGRGGVRAAPAQVARVALVLVLAGCLGLAACGGGREDGGATAGASTSVAAQRLGSEPLVARDPAGFEADLKGLRGRVVVVNFWASWCLPCRQEMPALQEVSRGYAEAGKPVTVIGVDASDVRDDAARFLTDVGVTYPTVYDRQGLNGGVAASWSVTGLPQTWFVAPDGSRAGRVAGAVTAADLRARVDELLPGP
jgi:thiol-disulfide isomerase/thioredoxin